VGKPCLEKPHISMLPCLLRARAIFSDDAHGGMLLLAAVWTPLMLSMIFASLIKERSCKSALGHYRQLREQS